jgi:hypothetical protein
MTLLVEIMRLEAILRARVPIGRFLFLFLVNSVYFSILLLPTVATFSHAGADRVDAASSW